MKKSVVDMVNTQAHMLKMKWGIVMTTLTPYLMATLMLIGILISCKYNDDNQSEKGD